MDDQNVFYVTEEGLQRIKEELEYLTTVKRLELSDRLQKAISQGDLSENADYHDAKREQGFLEGRIRELESSLRRSQVIEDHGRTDRVRIGCTVTVQELTGKPAQPAVPQPEQPAAAPEPDPRDEDRTGEYVQAIADEDQP